jgi:hypothetical protein
MVINGRFLVVIIEAGQIERSLMIPNPFKLNFNQTDIALLQFYFIGAIILVVFLALAWTELKKESGRRPSRLSKSST